MYYEGNFEFDQLYIEDDDGHRCACCSKLYIHDECIECARHNLPEKDCKCTGEDLRKHLEKENDIINLNEAGLIILRTLRDIKGLEHIDVIDVCRLSEFAKINFERLLYLPINEWVVYHAKAWAAHMIARAEGKLD